MSRYKCWHCDSELIWQGDHEGIESIEDRISVYACSNMYCSATYECTMSTTQVNDNEVFYNNKPKSLPTELLNQLQWAKDSLVGRAFINNKTKGIYYVKGITVDTETLELRVIYVDGISINEWDRPLTSFIQKFTKYNGGRKYE